MERCGIHLFLRRMVVSVVVELVVFGRNGVYGWVHHSSGGHFCGLVYRVPEPTPNVVYGVGVFSGNDGRRCVGDRGGSTTEPRTTRTTHTTHTTKASTTTLFHLLETIHNHRCLDNVVFRIGSRGAVVGRVVVGDRWVGCVKGNHHHRETGVSTSRIIL